VSEIREEAASAGEALEQTVRTVRLQQQRLELIRVEEPGERVRPLQVVLFSSQTEQQQKDVTAAGNSMADA